MSPARLGEGASRSVAGLLPVAAIAGCVVGVAEANGGYDLTVRTTLAVLVWWAVGLAVVLGVAPGLGHARAAAVPWLAFAFFAAWTGLSIRWAVSNERAYDELARVLLYLGVFTLGAVLTAPGRLRLWRDGLALGIACVGVLALVSRFFPGALATGGTSILPALQTRLSYPVGYWNGLGILLALGLPLLLTAAVDASRAQARAAAVAAFPISAVAIYLTSSRGAVVAGTAGLAVALATMRQRWPALAALLVATSASAVAAFAVSRMHTIVDGPFGGPGAAAEGRQAAGAVAAAALAAGAGWLVLERLQQRVRRPSRGFAAALAGLACAAALGALVAADVPNRFDEFRQPPATTTAANSRLVTSHLLSSNGSGRWQFWHAALDELRSKPLHGRGAGSYEAWWAEHGSLPMFVRDAHSLYLETLGELGAVGLVLLVLALLTALVTGARRAVRREDAASAAASGLIGTATVFLVAAGIDWMWELTVVGAIGVLSLGVLAGAAGAGASATAGRAARPVAVLLTTVAAAALVLQLPPLLAQSRLDASRSAASDGRLQRAADEARRARALEPWAAGPYLQLALVAEQAGDLRSADASIRGAIDRDPADWRIWLTAARVQTEAGRVAAARRSLSEARRLNPRSPILRSDLGSRGS